MPATKRELGERIKRLREAAGLNQRELAAAVGVRQTHISRLERGESGIGGPVLFAIATTLRTTVESLADEKTPAEPAAAPEKFLSPDENDLVRDYRSLTKADKLVARKMVRSLVRAVELPKVDDIREIEEAPLTPVVPIRPVEREEEPKLVTVRVTVRAAAGSPISSDRQPDEMEIDADLVGKRKMEICRAVGDSMVGAGITDGTYLLCEAVGSTFNYHAGDVVVARILDETGDEGSAELVVKRFAGTRKGITTLLSESSTHGPIELPRPRVHIEGVVRYRLSESCEWVPVLAESVKGRR
jgi:transcriptional regulator with XRE-family HTH domain